MDPLLIVTSIAVLLSVLWMLGCVIECVARW